MSNTFNTDYDASPLVIEQSRRLLFALPFILKLILVRRVYWQFVIT